MLDSQFPDYALGTLAPIVCGILAVMFAIMAFMRFVYVVVDTTQGVGSGFAKTAVCMLLCGVFGFISLSMYGRQDSGSEDGAGAKEPEATKEPGPEVTPSPAPESAPLEVPWGIVGAGALIIVAVAVAGLLIWYFGSRGKARLDERRQAAEIRDERQAELDRRWEKALQTHNDLNAQWHKYESSLEEILANPLMRNLTDPAVTKTVRLMGKANSLRSENPPRLGLHDTIGSVGNYIDVVDEYQAAFNAARMKSELRGIRDFSDEDQKRLRRARSLLATAMDEAASENEKQLALDQMVKLIQQVQVSLPEEALQQLEISTGLTVKGELTAGTQEATSAAA